MLSWTASGTLPPPSGGSSHSGFQSYFCQQWTPLAENVRHFWLMVVSEDHCYSMPPIYVGPGLIPVLGTQYSTYQAVHPPFSCWLMHEYTEKPGKGPMSWGKILVYQRFKSWITSPLIQQLLYYQSDDWNMLHLPVYLMFHLNYKSLDLFTTSRLNMTSTLYPGSPD